MGMIVVDASVAVKWFVPEVGEKAAQRLLNGGQAMVAPALIRMEVTGGIMRHYREKRITESSARSACEDWKAMLAGGFIELIDDAELFDPALELAFKCNHKIAECLYIAAGKMMDYEIITADKPMLERGIKGFRRITMLDLSDG